MDIRENLTVRDWPVANSCLCGGGGVWYHAGVFGRVVGDARVRELIGSVKSRKNN